MVLALGTGACGGTQKPQDRAEKSSGMKELAAEIDAHLAEIAHIVHTRRADCPALASELRAVFTRMKVSIDRAHAAQKDPGLAKELTAELRAYDANATKYADAIAADFAEVPDCGRDEDVQKAIREMPTL